MNLTQDSSALPTYPLSIIDIQFSTASQGAISQNVMITIEPIEVFDGEGNPTVVPLDVIRWRANTEVLGFLSRPASSSFAATAPSGGLGLHLESGSSLLTVPVIYVVEPAEAVDAERPPIAAIATSGWMQRSGTELWEVLAIPLGRGDDVLVEIVGAVDALPTIDPGQIDALFIDLPTLLWAERGPGRAVRPVSEYWVSLEADTPSPSDALKRAPIEAVEVQLLDDRRAELTSNPAALSSIGAMSVGFIAAAAFAVAGFLATVMVSARERSAEFALLYALGLTSRQHRRWMLLEQFVLVVTGLLIGTLLGLALASLILPVVSLAQDGAVVYPDVVVRYPWRRIALLEIVLVVGLVVGSVAVRVLRSRRSLARTLRGVDAA